MYPWNPRNVVYCGEKIP